MTISSVRPGEIIVRGTENPLTTWYFTGNHTDAAAAVKDADLLELRIMALRLRIVLSAINTEIGNRGFQ